MANIAESDRVWGRIQSRLTPTELEEIAAAVPLVLEEARAMREKGQDITNETVDTIATNLGVANLKMLAYNLKRDYGTQLKQLGYIDLRQNNSGSSPSAQSL